MSKVKMVGWISLVIDDQPFDFKSDKDDDNEDRFWMPFVLNLGDRKLSELIEWEDGEPHLPVQVGFGLQIPAKKLSEFLAQEAANDFEATH